MICTSNHHGAESSVTWLVEQSAIKLLILIRYYGKTNFKVQRNFNVTLYWQQFSRFVLGLFFLTSKQKDNAVKLRQYLEILYKWFFSGEMLLDCIAIRITWWLTSNRKISRAINIKFDEW